MLFCARRRVAVPETEPNTLKSFFIQLFFFFHGGNDFLVGNVLKSNSAAKARRHSKQMGTEDGGSVLAGAIHTYIQYQLVNLVTRKNVKFWRKKAVNYLKIFGTVLNHYILRKWVILVKKWF